MKGRRLQTPSGGGPSRPKASQPRAHTLAALFACALGCAAKQPPSLGKPSIEGVDLVGVESVDQDRLREGLATRESPTFLLMRGVVYDYELLDEALLERDLERVERFYAARGYHEAKVTGARVIWTAPDTVRVAIIVNEGAPVRIASGAEGAIAVQLNGLESIQDPTAIARIITASPRPGEILDEDHYEQAKREMLRILGDRGFAFASVSGRMDVDLARHEARLSFQIDAGEKAVFGPIEIVGLDQIPEDKVRESLLIAPGDEYSSLALEDARRALVNLGVFSSVSVEADTRAASTRRVPVKFAVHETAPRTIRLGGGARLDALQLSGSLTASWDHRNFLGGLRHLSVEARPGVVLFPTRMSDFPDLAAPNRALFEGALEVRFTQPSFIEGRTRGLSSASLEVRPLLYADTQPDEALIGFLEIGTRAGIERPFLSHQLFITPTLNWQAALPLDYRELSLGQLSPPAATGQIDNLFIAFPELAARLDFRDDPLDPKNGLFISNSLQAALPVLGGNVSDLRIRPEARFYITKTNLTLAVRATTGLLFPRNYDTDDTSSFDDRQKLLFRGFFSGGPFSNRGYAFQGVGDHEPLPFSTDPRVRCASTDGPSTDPRCLRPVGGLTLWEMSLELRFPLFSPLGAVLFLDSSDVRPGRVEYGLDTPHLAPGIGLRYPTPVGPVRLDMGFRVLEFLDKEEVEGSPPYIFGAPLTLQLAVGQAF